MKTAGPDQSGKFSLVLPVLFYEYLAISITRSILPGMLVASFGRWTYGMVGIIETVKGLLAFFACPLFGKISDKIGRKYCLLITVTGTTFPMCVMAFTSNMWVYVVCVGISGLFSATFPLTFAYIADCVDADKRAPAYGLALATLGLSFTIGPPMGGYVNEKLGSRAVFTISFILVIIDALYILFVLPETVSENTQSGATTLQKKINAALEYLPNTWDLGKTFRIFRADPFMRNIAQLVFIYYTTVWAVVSTLMVYVTRHLDFSPVTVGWLLSFYGLSTMFSEGILVRYIVPVLGEMHSMRLGLLCFTIQTVLLAFSSSSSWIFASVAFSMVSNLFYPSLSSLVSKIVTEEEQGEAQGTLNGIKALTEGFGPLLFGGLMALFEGGSLPSGSPYLLAAIGSLWALLHTFELPDHPDIQASALWFPSINYSIPSAEQKGLLVNSSDEEDNGTYEISESVRL